MSWLLLTSGSNLDVLSKLFRECPVLVPSNVMIYYEGIKIKMVLCQNGKKILQNCLGPNWNICSLYYCQHVLKVTATAKNLSSLVEIISLLMYWITMLTYIFIDLLIMYKFRFYTRYNLYRILLWYNLNLYKRVCTSKQNYIKKNMSNV